MATTNTIKIGLEIGDNGSLKLTTAEAKKLEKALADGQKAAVLLSKGISDPNRAKSLQDTVDQAKALTREVNRITAESKSASRALSSIKVAGGTSSQQDIGLNRGTAAGNARGNTRDFARQAQGMGGLVHTYATFAANIWAVTAAYQGLAKAYEAVRLEAGGEMLSATLGVSMKNLATDIEKASGHAVAFKEAMQFGALGTQAGLSTKQIIGLTTAAKGAANVLGRDVNDAITRMIRGTAKMEQEILDELGIFVRAKDAYKAYAKQMGYTSEDVLIQSERVKAYAEAVIKASEKYKQFAEIQDPFSKLSATISKAGTELLNFANQYITPVISSLSESGKLVEGLLVGGAAYLTKMALPALNNFKSMLLDNTKLIEAAKVSRLNELSAVEHRIDTLKASVQKIDFSGVATGVANSMNNGLNSTIISKALNNALGRTSNFADFEKNFRTSLTGSINGYKASATKAFNAGDIAGQQKWLDISKNIENNYEQIVQRTMQRIESEKVLTKSLEDQALIIGKIVEEEKLRVSLEKESGLETAAAKRAKTAEASSKLVSAMVGVGVIGTLSGEANLIELFDKETKGLDGIGKASVVAKTGLKSVAAAVEGLMGALSIALGVWLAWDLAIKPLLMHSKMLSDSYEKLDEVYQSLAVSTTTLKDTTELYNKILKSGSATLQDEIAAHTALSNSYNEISEKITEATEKTKKFNEEATNTDKYLENLKAAFGFGEYITQADTLEKLLDTLSKTKILAGNEKTISELYELNDQLREMSQTSTAIGKIWDYLKFSLSGWKAIFEGWGLVIDKVNEYNKKSEAGRFLSTMSNPMLGIPLTIYDKMKEYFSAQDAANEREKQALIEEIGYKQKLLAVQLKLKAAEEERLKGIAERHNNFNQGLTELQKPDIRGNYKFNNQTLALGAQSVLTNLMVPADMSSDVRNSWKGMLQDISIDLRLFSGTLTDPKTRQAVISYLELLNSVNVALSAGASGKAINASLSEKGAQKIIKDMQAVYEEKDKTAQQLAKDEREREKAQQKALALQELEQKIQQEIYQSKAQSVESDIKSVSQAIALEKESLGYATQKSISEQKELEIQKAKLIYNEALKKSEKEAIDNRSKKLPESKILALQQQQEKTARNILDDSIKSANITAQQVELDSSRVTVSQQLDKVETDLNIKKSLGLISSQDILETERQIAITKAYNDEKDVENQVAKINAQYILNSQLEYQKQMQEELTTSISVTNLQLEQISSIYVDNNSFAKAESLMQKEILETYKLKASTIAMMPEGLQKNLALEQASYDITKLRLEKEKQLFELTKSANGGTDTSVEMVGKEMAYRMEQIRKETINATDGITNAVFGSIDAGVDKLFEQLKAKKLDFKELFTTITDTFQSAIYDYFASQMKTAIKGMVTDLFGGQSTDPVKLQQDSLEQLKLQTKIQEDVIKNIASSATATIGLTNTIEQLKGANGALNVNVVSSSVSSNNANSVSMMQTIAMTQGVDGTTNAVTDMGTATVDTLKDGFMLLDGKLTTVAEWQANTAALLSVTGSGSNSGIAKALTSSTGIFGTIKGVFSGIKNVISSFTDATGTFTKFATSGIGQALGLSAMSGGYVGSLAATAGSSMFTGMAGLSGGAAAAGAAYAGPVSMMQTLAGPSLTGAGSALATAAPYIAGAMALISMFGGGLFGGGHVSRPKGYANTLLNPNGDNKNIGTWSNSDGNAQVEQKAKDDGLNIARYIKETAVKLGGAIEKSFIVGTKYMAKYNSTGVSIGKGASRYGMEFYYTNDTAEHIAAGFAQAFILSVKKNLVKLPDYLAGFLTNARKNERAAGNKKYTSVDALNDAGSLKVLYESLAEMGGVFKQTTNIIDQWASKSTFKDLQALVEVTKQYYSLFTPATTQLYDAVKNMRKSLSKALTDGTDATAATLKGRFTKILGTLSQQLPQDHPNYHKGTYDAGNYVAKYGKNSETRTWKNQDTLRGKLEKDMYTLQDYQNRLVALNTSGKATANGIALLQAKIDIFTDAISKDNTAISNYTRDQGIISQVEALFDTSNQAVRDMMSFHPDKALKAYNDIVTSIDTTTASGKELFTTLMSLSSSFAELVAKTNELNFQNVAKQFEAQLSLTDYLDKETTQGTKKNYAKFLMTNVLGLSNTATLKDAKTALQAYLNKPGDMTDYMTGVWKTFFSQVMEAADGAQANVTSIWGTFKSSIDNLIDAFKQARDSLREFNKSLLVGDLSNLTPVQKYNEAKSQFDALVATANNTSGSVSREDQLAAMGKIADAGTTFLTISKTMYASSQQYDTDFAYVRTYVEQTAQYADDQVTILKGILDSMTTLVTGIVDLTSATTLGLNTIVEQLKQSVADYATITTTSLASLLDTTTGPGVTPPGSPDVGGFPTTSPASNDPGAYSGFGAKYATKFLSSVSSSLLNEAGIKGKEKTADLKDMLENPAAYFGGQVDAAGAATAVLAKAFNAKNIADTNAAVGYYINSAANLGTMKAKDQITTVVSWLDGLSNTDTPTPKSIKGIVAKIKELGVTPSQFVAQFGVPAYARGGLAKAGISLVGEEGPELVDFKSPARVYTADQTKQMLHSNDNATLINELKALRTEVAQLRKEQQQQTGDIIDHNYNAQKRNAEDVVKGNKQATEQGVWQIKSRAALA